MTPVGRALVLVALAVTGIGAGALLALAGPDESRGSRSVRLAGPVKGDEGAERRLREQVAEYATDCKTASREPVAPALDARVDATAAIVCDAEGLAGTRLAVYQFPDIATAGAYLAEASYGMRLYGSCLGGDGDIRWSTRAGRERGSMLCIDEEPRVVWSDERRRTVTSLESGSAEMPALLAWWRKTFRPQTAASLKEVAVLRKRVRAVVGGARCTRSTADSPLASAAVDCTLPGSRYRGVSTLTVERLPSVRLLRKRVSAAGEGLSHTSYGDTGDSPAYRGRWMHGGRRAGTLVSYPEHPGDERYIWTLPRARLYVTYSFEGGNEQRAYRVWQRHLSNIGLQ